MFQSKLINSKHIPTFRSQRSSKIRSFKYSINKLNKPFNQSSQNKMNSSTLLYNKNEQIKPIKRISQLYNEIKRQENFINQTRNEQEDTYIQTFTSFITRQRIKKCKNWNNKQNEQKQKFISLYVDDHQCKESSFSLLNNMIKPYQFINNELNTASKELQRQTNDILMLRAELQGLNRHVLLNLKDIEDFSLSKIQELQKRINNEKISQNQMKMRSKRQISLLLKAIELNSKILSNLQQRNLQIQGNIFNCHPFQLEFKDISILQIQQVHSS